MTTDGKKAHDALLTYDPLSKKGYCWYYVWRAYAEAGASTNQRATPTAYAAWNATDGRHPGDRNPPPGAAIWLGRRKSDGNMDGDVFIAGEHDGDHAATDYPSWGAVGLCTIQQRINQTGREYLGWSDHVLDCPIDLDNAPSPKPTNNEDDEMKIFSVTDNGGYFFATSRGLVKVRNPDELEILRRFIDYDTGKEPEFNAGQRDIINYYLTAPVLSWNDLNPS